MLCLGPAVPHVDPELYGVDVTRIQIGDQHVFRTEALCQGLRYSRVHPDKPDFAPSITLKKGGSYLPCAFLRFVVPAMEGIFDYPQGFQYAVQCGNKDRPFPVRAKREGHHFPQGTDEFTRRIGEGMGFDSCHLCLDNPFFSKSDREIPPAGVPDSLFRGKRLCEHGDRHAKEPPVLNNALEHKLCHVQYAPAMFIFHILCHSLDLLLLHYQEIPCNRHLSPTPKEYRVPAVLRTNCSGISRAKRITVSKPVQWVGTM
ncbi:MAG: hypothetical protein A4E58_00535 [Syntrophorhabdus sp. PtaB.Bin006]|nr:MAG: hypothetical protein A4E58_00535 [Syntrophorhabdus sp. PtaB.Bin006]